MFEEEFIRKEFTSEFDGKSDWYLLRKGRENAPCIIMLHGHGSNGDQLIKRADKIEYQTRHLIAGDFSVISANIRGNSWMSDAARADLYQIINAERANLKWSKLFCIAGSMGGTGALIFAMHHPELLDGVGALGAATDLNAYIDFLAPSTIPVFQEIRSAIIAGFPTETIRKESSVLFHPEKFTMPVVYFHGGNDEIIPTAQARAFAEAMKGKPNFIYRELPGGNHDSPIPFFKEILDILISK